MRAVLDKDTKPEMKVRRLTHAMGFRYRLHVKDLPGKPDIVFPGRKKVIFVHGCFWHQHSCPRGDRIPKTRRDYWEKKLGNNKRRDRRHRDALRRQGWKSLVVWECQLKDLDKLARRIKKFLEESED